MALQLDTSLYKTDAPDLSKIDPYGIQQARLKGLKDAEDRRIAIAKRNSDARTAMQEEQKQAQAHRMELEKHKNSVRGTVARYVKAFPEEKRAEIWNTRAKQSLKDAGLDVSAMPAYDPAELEAWDLNSNDDNVRSRNLVAERKDQTTRFINEQNNATKMMLQQYKSQHQGKVIVRGKNGNIWLQSKTDPNDHVDTGLGFDQSKAFLAQETDGSFSIINYEPGNAAVATPVAPAGTVATPVAPTGVTQTVATPPKAVVTDTGVSKKKPIPATDRDHITVAVDQLNTIDNLEQEILEAIEEEKNPNKTFAQNIVPATGIVPGLINTFMPGGKGPQVNNLINPKSAKLRATLGRLESIGLKDLSGKAITVGELGRSNQWMPNTSDPIDSSLIPKVQQLKKWYRQKLIEGAESFNPETTGWAPEPMLKGLLAEGFQKRQEIELADKKAELKAQQDRLAAAKLSLSEPTTSDSSNVATLGKRQATHFIKGSGKPPGGWAVGDTKVNSDGDKVSFDGASWKEVE